MKTLPPKLSAGQKKPNQTHLESPVVLSLPDSSGLLLWKFFLPCLDFRFQGRTDNDKSGTYF